MLKRLSSIGDTIRDKPRKESHDKNTKDVDLNEFLTDIEWRAREILKTENELRKKNALLRKRSTSTKKGLSSASSIYAVDTKHSWRSIKGTSSNDDQKENNGSPSNRQRSSFPKVHKSSSPKNAEKSIKSNLCGDVLKYNSAYKSLFINHSIPPTKSRKFLKRNDAEGNTDLLNIRDCTSDSLRKKYRCSKRRMMEYHAYEETVREEKRLHDDLKDYVSSIKSVEQHPIVQKVAFMLDALNAASRKMIKGMNETFKFDIDVDSLWENLPYTLVGSNKVPQLRVYDSYCMAPSVFVSEKEFRLEKIVQIQGENSHQCVALDLKATQNSVQHFESNRSCLMTLVRNERFCLPTDEGGVEVLIKIQRLERSYNEIQQALWLVKCWSIEDDLHSALVVTDGDVKKLRPYIINDTCLDEHVYDKRTLLSCHHSDEKRWCNCKISVITRESLFWVVLSVELCDEKIIHEEITVCEVASILQLQDSLSSFDISFWVQPKNNYIWELLLNRISIDIDKLSLHISEPYVFENGGQLPKKDLSSFFALASTLVHHLSATVDCYGPSSRVPSFHLYLWPYIDESSSKRLTEIENNGDKWMSEVTPDTPKSLLLVKDLVAHNAVSSTNFALMPEVPKWWKKESHISWPRKEMFTFNFDEIEGNLVSADRTQAITLFKRGRCTVNAIKATTSMFIEKAWVVPPQVCIETEFFVPDPIKEMPIDDDGVYIKLNCHSLLSEELKSNFDNLKPVPVMILNAVDNNTDDGIIRSNSPEGSLKAVEDFNSDGFRVKFYVESKKYLTELLPVKVGIQRKGLTPNTPTVIETHMCPPGKPCISNLTRTWKPKDFKYIVTDRHPSKRDGCSQPSYFVTHMDAYGIKRIERRAHGECFHYLVEELKSDERSQDESWKKTLADGTQLYENRSLNEIEKIRNEVLSNYTKLTGLYESDTSKMNNNAGEVILPQNHSDTRQIRIKAVSERLEESSINESSFKWRNLPNPVFPEKFFELSKHKIEKCQGEVFNQGISREIIGVVKPKEAVKYEVDSALFDVAPTTMFIKNIIQLETKTEDETQEEPTTRALMAAKIGDLSSLEELINLGVDVDTKDEYGNTLLLLVAQQGNKRVLKFLLRRGATINAQNHAGNTVLHFLFEYEHTALGNYLVSKGADDSLLNTDGLTCYEGLSLSKLDDL